MCNHQPWHFCPRLCGPIIRIPSPSAIPAGCNSTLFLQPGGFRTILQAFRVAEQINIPVMVNLMVFAISHCLMPLTVPRRRSSSRFLPPHQPEWARCCSSSSFCNAIWPAEYATFRQMLSEDMQAYIAGSQRAAPNTSSSPVLWDGDTIDTYRRKTPKW